MNKTSRTLQQIVFNEVFLIPCSNIFYMIMSLKKWWTLSYPVTILSPVNNQSVYIRNVFWRFHKFHILLTLHADFFETCCWHQIQNNHIFTKISDVDEVNIKYFVIVLFLNEYHVKKITKYLHFVVFMFYVQTFGEWGLWQICFHQTVFLLFN